MPTPRVPSEPCAGDPGAWDLDAGELIQWLAAIRTCRESCPLLATCVSLREQLYPGSGPGGAKRDNPRSVIWAGVAYSETGEVLTPDSLRILAARRRGAAVRAVTTAVTEAARRAY